MKVDIFDHPKFKEALRICVEEEMKEIDERIAQAGTEEFEFSDKHKIRMNRMLRERVGVKDRIPYPEVDTKFERCRSSLVRSFLIIEDRLQKAIKNAHLHA